jgi:hypothetical protein
LSAWFDFDTRAWKYDIQMCGLDVKLWWVVHVVDLVALGVVVLSLVGRILSLAKPRPVVDVRHESSTKKTNANGYMDQR